ncbi:MAG: GGDEF domain-containing protein [Gammaproteobacteria bacterium]|nr:GGDEF domain-containing protein [Gammaproteobacteria bacterium]
MIKKKITLVLISGIIAITFLILGSTELKKKIQNLNHQWEEINQSVFIKLELLENFYRDFGYTGFIHSFKNFLLRKDLLYLVNAQKKLSSSLASLHRLKNLNVSQSELNAIESIEKVAHQYQLNLYKLNLIIRQTPDLNITDVDKILRVRDEPATIALEKLQKSFKQINKKQKDILNDEIQTSIQYLNLLFYLLLPIIILVMTGYIGYMLKLDKSFNEIKAIFLSSPSALIISDDKGRILNQNDNAVKLLGYSPQQFSSMAIEDLIEKKQFQSHIVNSVQIIKNKILDVVKSETEQNVVEHSSFEDEFQVKASNNALIPVKIHLTSYLSGDKPRVIFSLMDLRKKKKLEVLSQTDALTQIKNRGYLNKRLSDEFSRAQRYERNLALILLDIDFFKQVNDQHGHASGDKVLIHISRILETRVRSSDTVGRFGGEEFLIICPETDKDSAIELAENIRKCTASIECANGIKITLSLGVSLFEPKSNKHLTIEDLLKHTDDALYFAKNNGRNQVSYNESV